MIRRVKKLIPTFCFIISLIFLFAPGDFPDNSQFQKILKSVSQEEIIIIFNSGGWGNTPAEKAADFTPIIEGIQKTLNDLGYGSMVIPYKRTKNGFLGKIEGAREFVTSFGTQSGKLAREIEFFIENNPDTKVIMAGLSSGAAFVDKVMERLSKSKRDNIFAIEVGVPFWESPLDSENVLLLNDDKDPLSKRKTRILLASLFKAPFKWILAKISGKELSFSRALHVLGHDYFWDSPSVGPQIVSFLEDKIP